MKTTRILITIILAFILASCAGKQQSTNDIITVDVTANYPERELILQDFMDVEYIPLETTDEFITQGEVKAVGKKYIVVINWNNDGDIFIYDRSGKGIRKINRKGQSGEEYSMITGIILDEDNSELFVMDSMERTILIYDLFGTFKRSFKFADTSYYHNIFNYNKDNLITYKGYPMLGETDESSHIVFSKQDGIVLQKIQFPYERIEVAAIVQNDRGSVSPNFQQTLPFNDDWVIYRTSCDTLYIHSLDNNTTTPLLARTPSIHSMNSQVFLFPTLITERYYFMEAVKKEYDFTEMKGFPSTDLVYDKQEKAYFKYTLYNDDYTNKEKVELNSDAISSETPILKVIEAADIVEAYENGVLKGKLREIAAELNEEDNPVIMLVKHKK